MKFSITRSNRQQFLRLCLLFLQLSPAAIFADDVPVAPIEAASWMGWENAVQLKNERVEVVIVPELGRVTSLRAPGENNLFRYAQPSATNDWFNSGGSWLFPVAQTDWVLLQEEKWPPPGIIDRGVWESRAWKSSDGSQNCVLEKVYGAPLFIACKRSFRLARDQSALQIKQSITRLKGSDIPVVLWNISQISDAKRIVLPTARNTSFANGVQWLFGAIPSQAALTSCVNNLRVCSLDALGEVKLGTDSPNQWIAATTGSRMVLQQILTMPQEAEYPDGGCRIEMYTNPGIGYADIELLSPAVNLPVGRTIQNELRISLHHVDATLDDCELSEVARQFLAGDPGEKQAER